MFGIDCGEWGVLKAFKNYSVSSQMKNVASRDGKILDLICCQSNACIIIIDEDEFMAYFFCQMCLN
jgi:hypothetical protein